MSTISELLELKKLTKLDVELEEGIQPLRCIYALPEAMCKIRDYLPSQKSEWKITETPMEQLDSLLERFISGRTMVATKMFRVLKPYDNYTWELKTADLRLFGWFYKKDVFILSSLFMAGDTKKSGLYTGFSNEAAKRRDELSLDPPKEIKGKNPNDVISNSTSA